jgi:hypothetical protein
MDISIQLAKEIVNITNKTCDNLFKRERFEDLNKRSHGGWLNYEDLLEDIKSFCIYKNVDAIIRKFNEKKFTTLDNFLFCITRIQINKYIRNYYKKITREQLAYERYSAHISFHGSATYFPCI